MAAAKRPHRNMLTIGVLNGGASAFSYGEFASEYLGFVKDKPWHRPLAFSELVSWRPSIKPYVDRVAKSMSKHSSTPGEAFTTKDMCKLNLTCLEIKVSMPPCPYTMPYDSVDQLRMSLDELDVRAASVLKSKATISEFLAGVKMPLSKWLSNIDEWRDACVYAVFVWWYAKAWRVEANWDLYASAKVKYEAATKTFDPLSSIDPTQPGFVLCIDADRDEAAPGNLPWPHVAFPPGLPNGDVDASGRYFKCLFHPSLTKDIHWITPSVRSVAWPAATAAYGLEKTKEIEKSLRIWGFKYRSTVVVAAHFTAPSKRGSPVAEFVRFVTTLMTILKTAHEASAVLLAADTNLPEAWDGLAAKMITDVQDFQIFPDPKTDSRKSTKKMRTDAGAQAEKWWKPICSNKMVMIAHGLDDPDLVYSWIGPDAVLPYFSAEESWPLDHNGLAFLTALP